MVIVDLFPGNVHSSKRSNSLNTQFCMVAFEKGLASGSRAEIVQSEQACQFTSVDYVAILQAGGIRIS